MKEIRITCPDSTLSREDRIQYIIDSFDKWINSDAFNELLDLFGGTYEKNTSAISKIKWLKTDFIDIWDYRRKQREAQTKEGEAARWLLKNDVLVMNNKEMILNNAKRLGLIGIKESIYSEAEFILPLGGARLSNLRRCELARREQEHLDNQATIVALSGMRPISESERNGFIDTYAPDAKTEYDAMCCGMQHTFSQINDWEEKVYENSNMNLNYAIRHYIDKDGNSLNLYALAAPSTDSSRRSNSADCFKFFFEKFQVQEHSKIINCTSQIYCPYQQTRSLAFAIEHNVEFDTIGFPFALNNVSGSENSRQLSEPVNYLQEIKATVDAMYDFTTTFVSD